MDAARPPLNPLRTLLALLGAYTAANLSWFTQPFQFTVFSGPSGFGNVASGWILSTEIGLAALVSMGLGYFRQAQTTRTALAAGTLLCVVGSVATVLVASFPAILLSRMVAGIGEGLLIADVNRAVARLDDPEKRYGQINGLMNLAGFLLILSMPVALAPLHIDRAIFGFLAVATLICLAAVTLYPAVTAAPSGFAAAPRGIGGWRGWTVYAAVLVSSTGVSSFYPVTESLGRASGISESALDSALSMAYIGAIIGSYEGAWLDARLGRRGGALWVGIGLSCAVSLLVHAHSGWEFGAGMFLFGLFWFHGFVTCLGLAAEVDPAGGCAAACGGAFLLGGGIGPVLGGYELDWNGGDSRIFAWSVGVLMAAFVLSVWLVDRRRRQAAHAPSGVIEGALFHRGDAVDATVGSSQTAFHSRSEPLENLVRGRCVMGANEKVAASDALQVALDELHRDVYANNMAPYWVVDRKVAHDEDRQVMQGRKAVPFIWKYKRQIEPLLHRSADLIKTETSERRSLVLVNPGLAPQRATASTLYVAYRVNDPVEIMPPHRHSPNAIRLGLTGSMNFTGVEGENIVFGPGDLVLTPHDTWHNHGNRSREPAINLSVLDLPLVETLNSLYFEHDYTEEEEGKRIRRAMQTERFPPDYSQRVYGGGGFLPRFVSHRRGAGNASPMFLYRYDMMRELLEKFRDWDGDRHEALMVEYVDPTTGGPVYKTMTFFMQMLRPGERTLPLKQSASLVCSPFEGRGYSVIGGERIDWEPFDTFVVPGGTWCEHVNASDQEPAILFVATDEPTLKALSLYQKHGKNDNGDIVRLF